MMRYYHDPLLSHHFSGLFGFGFIFMIIFWILIIALAFLFLKRLGTHGFSYPGHEEKKQASKDSALNILKEKYARGEIEKEEFEQKKKDLE